VRDIAELNWPICASVSITAEREGAPGPQWTDADVER
jgi:hypothetical protein